MDAQEANAKEIKYTVYVDDNFHYRDEDERYVLGEFDTEEEAARAAKAIVDKFLLDQYSPETSAKMLYERYCAFGEDPWISPGSTFKAWQYAKDRCLEICSKDRA